MRPRPQNLTSRPEHPLVVVCNSLTDLFLLTDIITASLLILFNERPDSHSQTA